MALHISRNIDILISNKVIDIYLITLNHQPRWISCWVYFYKELDKYICHMYYKYAYFVFSTVKQSFVYVQNSFAYI